jgi:acyl-CoA reductase-like NAD-dependent aldehyde dehydrogenase
MKASDMNSMSAVQITRKQTISLGADLVAGYATYMSEQELFLADTKEHSCTNPSTKGFLWSVPDFGAQSVEIICERARIAQLEWSSCGPAERSRLLHQCADQLTLIERDLADILALETGKSVTKECHGEVKLLVSIFRYFAGLSYEVKGRSIQMGEGILGFTTQHPLGVVASIVPWNVPLMFMAYKTAAPLIAGNAVVVKMPEQATASLIACFNVLKSILPKDLVQFVSGSGDHLGNALIHSENIDKISFTGSTATGKRILAATSNTMVSTSLELGGKSPMIILEDCDINKAVDGIIASMRFTRAGQSCTAASRIYVHSSKIQSVQALLGEQLNQFKIGDALSSEVDCGPMVSKKQYDIVTEFLSNAKADGLDVRSYGSIETPTGQEGYFVKPHLVFNPDPNNAISREEIFGPVATISTYSDIKTVIGLANDSKYGLSGSVWGKNIDDCLNIAAKLRVGIVQINQNAIMLPGFSYGGLGNSGNGKESSLEAMIQTYMYEKTNVISLSSDSL